MLIFINGSLTAFEIRISRSMESPTIFYFYGFEAVEQIAVVIVEVAK